MMDYSRSHSVMTSAARHLQQELFLFLFISIHEFKISKYLTVDLPRCCATSNIRRGVLFCTSKALRIGGSISSNCTSTTAPMTATTRPLQRLAAAAAFGSAAYCGPVQFKIPQL